MTTRDCAIVLMLVLACSGSEPGTADTSHPSLTCGYHPSTRITPSGVGALQIGLSDSVVTSSCEVLRDSMETDAEGHPQRVMVVRIGASSIRAEIVNGSVWRLTIQDSLLRTADGMGVGTTLGELLREENLSAGNGETGVFVLLSRLCGLSFRIDPRAPGIPRPWIVQNRKSLARAPLTTPVDMVLIVGRGPNCAA
jgi:hypothetical protein